MWKGHLRPERRGLDYVASPRKARDRNQRRNWPWYDVAEDRVGGLSIVGGPDLVDVEPEGRSSGRSLR